MLVSLTQLEAMQSANQMGGKSGILSVKLNFLALTKLFSEGCHELQRLQNRVIFSPIIETKILWCISDSENGSSVQLLQNHRNSLALHRFKGIVIFCWVHRLQVMQEVAHVSLESVQSVYPSLTRLQCLVELENFAQNIDRFSQWLIAC